MKKKILIFTILLLSIFINFSIKFNVNATDSDSGLATYMVEKTNISKRYDYTLHRNESALTTYDSKASKQSVNVFTVPQTPNSKVVTWAVSNGAGFKFSTLPEIARDYEAKHPDWKVVGGINADQYIMSGGTGGVKDGTDYFYPQPYYPMIADGDSWFSIPCWPVSGGGNVVGIITDGTSDSLVNGSMNFKSGNIKISSTPVLSIYDENNNIIKKINIEKVNEKPGTGETSIYLTYIQPGEKDLTTPDMNVSGTNLFVVNKAELAYMSNSPEYTYKGQNATYALFAKGVLEEKSTSTVVKKGGFAIDTTNQELLSLLKVGVKVRAQYEFEGVLNTLESAIGYHTVQRMNDKDIASTAAYNTKAYSRSLIGRRANGDIVLITVDMDRSDSVGTKHEETNALLKHYGCVEAYQMDGGGSVAAVSRSDDGKIHVCNHPVGQSGDGTRRVLSGLFAVERRSPEYNCELVEVTDTTAKFKVELLKDYGREIKREFIKIGTKNYDVVDGYVTITGLRKNKEYTWGLYFEDTSVSSMKTGINGTFTATNDYLNRSIPTLKNCVINKVNEDMHLSLEFEDIDNSILSVTIKIDNEEFKFDKSELNKALIIPSLSDDIILEYIYNNGLGDKKVTIEYPQYKSNRLLAKMKQLQEEILNQFFR